MAEMEDLNAVRLRLVEALGDQSGRYFERMKQWFKMKITKEEFDLESRKNLSKEQIHLHNQFLLCLFQKCQGLAHISRSKAVGSNVPVISSVPALMESDCPSPTDSAKRLRASKKRHHSERTGFEPVEVVDYLPTLRSPAYQPTDEPQRSCAHELFLPDQAFLMGRLMLAAWDCGLDGANDSAADLLVCAVQHFLKTLLTAVISQRNTFKLHFNHFPFAMGSSIPNPWLRNAAFITHQDSPTEILELTETHDSHRERREEDYCDAIHLTRLRETRDEIEDREIREAACSVENLVTAKQPISAWNLLSALQTHRSAVLSQTVYSINVERISTKLNHPSWDDEEAALARNGSITGM